MLANGFYKSANSDKSDSVYYKKNGFTKSIRIADHKLHGPNDSVVDIIFTDYTIEEDVIYKVKKATETFTRLQRNKKLSAKVKV